MNELVGGIAHLGWVAVKAALLFLTAVFGFRLGERRTLAEMSAFDFVAAVAVGAIVGRVPNSTSTSYLEGAVTLVTVLVAHGIISRLRLFPPLALLFDHPPRVLVRQGDINMRQLRRCALTKDDLFAILRKHGIVELKQVHLAIFEQRGEVSIVKVSEVHGTEPELVRDVIGKKAR